MKLARMKPARMKLGFKLAFFGYPLAELVLLLVVASRLGALATLALLLLGGIAGLGLLRGQQLSVLARLRRGLPSAGPFLPELLDGALRAAAAVLLIVPGFISDGLALILLVPAVRRRLAQRLAARRGPEGPIVIEGEFRRLDEAAIARRDPGCC
jgi:UPF0716 protein FxsA